MNHDISSTPDPKSRLSLSLDLRWVVIILLLIIISMIALWRPWNMTSAKDRTIQVTGDATVKAAPDSYVFYPTYQVINADRTAALREISQKSDSVIAELKKLGVPDSKIKTTANGYDYPVSIREKDTDTTYSLQLTITVDSRELSQKVQDYLMTTAPTGSVSPQASFSDAKRKQLESQARDLATKDARAKADQSAKNLGFRVGTVKTVADGSGFGGSMPIEGRAAQLDASTSSAGPKLSVQPGENDLSYTVSVTYYVR